MGDAKSAKPNFIKSIGILSALMAASKVFSLIREIAIASSYGASASTDAYFVASGFVTNVFFGITAALATVFVPYYINLKKTSDVEEKSHAVSALLTSLATFSIAVVIILYIIAPWIIRLIAPSYTETVFQEAVLYMRIYSLTILFSLLTNMLTALLNAESRYEFGAIASVVYSMVSITLMVALKEVIGVTALAMSVPISFFIQLIILLFVSRKHFRFKLVFQLINPTVKKLIVLMIPVLLSNTTVEINQLLTRSIATNLNEGAVSILTYSNTLFNFVSQLMMTTFITLFFTELTIAAKDGADSAFNRKISQAINLIVIVILPVAAITFFFSKDIVSIAYGRGKFDSNSVALTATCLSIYSVAFVFDCIRNLLIKAFYARENTKTPLINSIISLVITVVGSFVLSRWLGINGIVLSICVSLFVAAIFLSVIAKRQICTFESKRILATVSKATISIGATSIVLFALSRLLSGRSMYLRFGGACFIGFGCYLLLLVAMKCDEVKMILNMLKRKKA